MKIYFKYIFKRLIYMLVTLLIIITATFFLMQFLPGTPFGNDENMTPTQLQFLYEKYGLDQPMHVQYFRYLKNILKGDFGVSFQFNNTPVAQIIASRAGPSMILAFQGLVFGTIIGIFLGIISAVNRNTWIDTFTSMLAIGGRSVPNFIFAVVLQFIFAVTLSWFPIAFWRDGFMSTVLPSLALSIQPMAESARFIRTEMIEVLGSDYIELAKAKGFSQWYIIMKHALRNAIIPLLTILGPLMASMMTGSLVVENIFSIPGIGEQFTKSILVNDYPTIMGITIMYSFILVVIILVVDILYGLIDPRLRTEGGI